MSEMAASRLFIHLVQFSQICKHQLRFLFAVNYRLKRMLQLEYKYKNKSEHLTNSRYITILMWTGGEKVGGGYRLRVSECRVDQVGGGGICVLNIQNNLEHNKSHLIRKSIQNPKYDNILKSMRNHLFFQKLKLMIVYFSVKISSKGLLVSKCDSFSPISQMTHHFKPAQTLF